MNISGLQPDQPIGIFDSGIGGLTVARAIREKMPEEQIIYFGDTAHLPYGDKAPSSILHYTEVICNFLLEKNCKAIVVACNTASSIAGDLVLEVCEGKAIAQNVIDPVVDYITSNKKYNTVGVIGTKGTIKSGVYPNKLQAKQANLDVKTLATPLFVPVIEEMLTGSDISKAVIKEYLSNREFQNIEALILGCTHYPLIRSEIEDFYQGETDVLDAAILVAEGLKALLKDSNLSRSANEAPNHQFYVSDYTDSFETMAQDFFGKDVHLEECNIW